MTDQATITKHIRFPFQFDETLLLQDLRLATDEDWIDHFNVNGYEGTWNSISLYAPGGDSSNIFAHALDKSKPMKETNVMARCSYFKEVLNSFECTFLSVRLLSLGVGANIKPHKDYNLGYEDGCFRIHVPITTNPKVSFILDDVRLDMKPGECWYTNVNYTHSVKNEGTADRVHLVFDCKRNQWSDSLFYSVAPAESFRVPDQKPYSPEVQQRIIEELERSKPDGYMELINDIRSK